MCKLLKFTMQIWDLLSSKKDVMTFFKNMVFYLKDDYVGLVTKLKCTSGNKYFRNVMLNCVKRKSKYVLVIGLQTFAFHLYALYTLYIVGQKK